MIRLFLLMELAALVVCCLGFYLGRLPATNARALQTLHLPQVMK